MSNWAEAVSIINTVEDVLKEENLSFIQDVTHSNKCTMVTWVGVPSTSPAFDDDWVNVAGAHGRGVLYEALAYRNYYSLAQFRVVLDGEVLFSENRNTNFSVSVEAGRLCGILGTNVSSPNIGTTQQTTGTYYGTNTVSTNLFEYALSILPYGVSAFASLPTITDENSTGATTVRSKPLRFNDYCFIQVRKHPASITGYNGSVYVSGMISLV